MFYMPLHPHPPPECPIDLVLTPFLHPPNGLLATAPLTLHPVPDPRPRIYPGIYSLPTGLYPIHPAPPPPYWPPLHTPRTYHLTLLPSLCTLLPPRPRGGPPAPMPP